MKKLFAVAALGTTLFAGNAYAQGGPGRMDPLAQADANHDGNVTRAEMLASVDQRFARADTTRDGRITAQEREAAAAAMREQRGGERMQGRVDANGDGVVTVAEQRAEATQRFDMVDTNRDGTIDRAEREAIRARMMAMRGRGADGPPPVDGPDAPDGE